MKKKLLRFLGFFILTIAWLVLMRIMTAPLDPGVVLEFEFIGTARNAVNFLSARAVTGELELLTRSIFLDFIFLFLYGATLYYATAWICAKLSLGHIFNNLRDISVLIIIAVVCDLFENLSLFKLIYYPPEDFYAYSAYFLATVKFIMLGLIVSHFILSGLIVIVESKKTTANY